MSSRNLLIHYIFIGDVYSKTELIEYSPLPQIEIQTHNDTTKIFNKICAEESITTNEHSQIIANHSTRYFFTILPPAIFILVEVDTNYIEKNAFKMIKHINEDHIPLMLDEKGKINNLGKEALIDVIEKYQDVNNITKISDLNEADSIKIDGKDNVSNIIVSVGNVKELEDKQIKDGTEQFNKEKIPFKKKIKLIVIITIIVILLLLVIVLPFMLLKKHKNDDDAEE